jgi:hypothetical protein
MGKGFEAGTGDKYALGDPNEVASQIPTNDSKTTDAEDKAASSNDKPKRSTVELVEDYRTVESEAVISDPHGSCKILPGFVATPNEDSEFDGLDALPEPVKKPKLGAFGAVDETKQKEYEAYCIAVAKREIGRGQWQAAIHATEEGLDIDPNSRKLDRLKTQAYISWGSLLLSQGQWGDAAVVFRDGIESDPRKLDGLRQGLEDANAGERTIRIRSCNDKPCAVGLLVVAALTLLLGVLGAANIAPVSQCEQGVCLNDPKSCEEDLMSGEFTCDCAPGWGGPTCDTALQSSNDANGTATPGLAPTTPAPPPSTWSDLTTQETNVLVGSLLAAAMGSSLFGLFWLFLLRRGPRRLLQISIGLGVPT